MNPELATIVAQAFAMWSEGVKNRHHALHTPTLATVGLDGRPRQRTVVLRAVDGATRMLQFHTDSRSAKMAELAADPRVALHGYDSEAKVQIRLEGRATLHADDAIARAAWEASQPMSRACYAQEPGPGTVVAQARAVRARDRQEAMTAGFSQFVVVRCVAFRMEWLDLSVAGHRRAAFDWQGDAAHAHWLAP